MNYGRLIRVARQIANVTQTELGKKLDLSQSAIGGYERGRFKPSVGLFHRVCRELGLNPNDVIEADHQAVQQVKGAGIPLINKAPAGEAVDYEEYGTDSGQGYEYLAYGNVDPKLDPFAVEIVGDSMKPTLYEGDYVVFAPVLPYRAKPILKDGSVVFVRFSAESRRQGCTVGRFRLGDDGYHTIAKDNPEYESIRIAADSDDVARIAVAIEIRTDRGLED
jgi:phage repressor protein C with HTH and peptisase S24 domain